MSDLTNLPNVGGVLERELLAVGIVTAEELRRAGSREAFLRIRGSVDPGACLHVLYGLEGAVRGIPDRELDAGVKEELKTFYRGVEGAGHGPRDSAAGHRACR